MPPGEKSGGKRGQKAGGIGSHMEDLAHEFYDVDLSDLTGQELKRKFESMQRYGLCGIGVLEKRRGDEQPP
jgi:hypothetical protein